MIRQTVRSMTVGLTGVTINLHEGKYLFARGTSAYNDGVALVTLTRLGLMGEFTISGAKFKYKPVSAE